MKKIFLTVVIVAGMIACKDKKDKAASGGTSIDTTATNSTIPIATEPVNDTAEIKTVVNGFYNWYAKEYKSLMGFNLYSSIKKKESPPYKINWDEVEKLQSYIRGSVPQLGEEFLVNQKKMLQQADSAFKVDVSDEIPYGFDYDWYTNSQEDAQYTVDEINKAKEWLIRVSGDNATVDIKSASNDTVLKLTMKKEGGTWKIARIGEEF